MPVLDNNLLSDYLDGTAEAKAFLEQYEADIWAVSATALYEAYIGSIYG